MTDQERELDLLVAELEQENRLLRARNQRLEKELAAICPPPTECMTKAEMTAFAFGWWKAMEHAKGGDSEGGEHD